MKRSRKSVDEKLSIGDENQEIKCEMVDEFNTDRLINKRKSSNKDVCNLYSTSAHHKNEARASKHKQKTEKDQDILYNSPSKPKKMKHSRRTYFNSDEKLVFGGDNQSNQEVKCEVVDDSNTVRLIKKCKSSDAAIYNSCVSNAHHRNKALIGKPEQKTENNQNDLPSKGKPNKRNGGRREDRDDILPIGGENQDNQKIKCEAIDESVMNQLIKKCKSSNEGVCKAYSSNEYHRSEGDKQETEKDQGNLHLKQKRMKRNSKKYFNCDKRLSVDEENEGNQEIMQEVIDESNTDRLLKKHKYSNKDTYNSYLSNAYHPNGAGTCKHGQETEKYQDDSLSKRKKTERNTGRYFDITEKSPTDGENQDNQKLKHEVVDESDMNRLIKNCKSPNKNVYNSCSSTVNYKNDTRAGEQDTVNDQKLFELKTYYDKILQTFETIPKGEKEIFICNVLAESSGHEVKLAVRGSSSHCIELLLSACENPDLWMKFMTAFAAEKIEVFTNRNASHITELLLNIAIRNIQDWFTILEADVESSEKKNIPFFISWIADFGSFVMENLESCLQDPYASHVACTVIQALGGDMSKASSHSSKRSENHKKDFHQQYVGEGNVKSKEQALPVILESIPKFFKKTLKKIAKSLLKIDAIRDYVLDSSSATVIETLLKILKKRVPKYCRKLVCGLTTSIFSERNNDGLPQAFLHRNISFVVENMLHAADEELQVSLWEEYFANCLEPLIMHRVGNFVVQRLFDVVESHSLFEKMMEKTGNFFEKILSSRHYGIFLSIARACNRLNAQQALFMKSLMQCLQCAEPDDRQTSLVPLLLGFQTFDKSQRTICLQGSLLTQAILKFQKPRKVVLSLLNMKPEELSNLACHTQGCHVLHSFFSSNTVGEKNKDKLIQCLKPCLVDLACDRNGSLTLSRLWVILSIKQKSVIAETLAQSEQTLQENRDGNILLKKFCIFHFKKNNSKWKEIQINFSHPNHQNVKQ